MEAASFSDTDNQHDSCCAVLRDMRGVGDMGDTMSDLLNEAVKRWDGWQYGDTLRDMGTLDIILDAARKVANAKPLPFARYGGLGGISLESCDPEDADVWIVDAAALGIGEK